MYKYLLAIGCMFITCNSNTQGTSTLNEKLNIEGLEKALLAFKNDPQIKPSQWGFYLSKVKTGEKVYEIEGEKQLLMASCMKLVTSITALELYGENFSFETNLYYTGKIEGNILKGDLIIVGSGDPTLGAGRINTNDAHQLIDKLTAEIKKLNIQQITGHLIVDDSKYSYQATPEGWIWADIGNYYGAPAKAINFNENLYKIYFQPGKQIGDTTKIIKIEPPIKNLDFINHVTTAKAGSGDNAYIYGAPYTYQRYIKGTIPQGGTFSIKGSLPDPAQQLANALIEQLTIQNIQISKSPRIIKKGINSSLPDTKNITLLYKVNSPSLSQIIQPILINSVNLYAESLKNLIEEKTSIENYWIKKGIDLKSASIEDGSGLSRISHLSPQQLVHLLNIAAKQPYFKNFYDALPTAGISGTMANLGKGTLMQGNMRAKTGSMSGIIAFAGYYKTASGELMSFCIAVNHFKTNYTTMKQKIEEVFVEMMKV